MTQAESNPLSPETQRILFPLSMIISDQGRITSLGPTLERMFSTGLTGTDFRECFSITRPRHIRSATDLRSHIGLKFNLTGVPPTGPPLDFRGVAAPMQGSRDLLIDLSLGQDVAEVVARFGLTRHDFRANDFSLDLIYAIETKRALLKDSEKLAKALEAAKLTAEKRANTDPVTSISNRRALNSHIEALLQGPESPRSHCAMHIDLNLFKKVNDTFGHAAGDVILRHVATCMTEVIGPTDFAARIGGDEFVLILSPSPPAPVKRRIAEELREKVAQPLQVPGGECMVSCSIGIADFGRDEGFTCDKVLLHSDLALYAAKERCDGITLLTPELLRDHRRASELIGDMHLGLHRQEFVPFFQPQIDWQTREVSGVEVLARWQRSEKTVLSPPQFMDAAIKANLLDQIDAQVRQKALSAFAALDATGQHVGNLSLNVTGSNLMSNGYCETLLDEVFAARLTPDRIQLELLESILFDTRDFNLIHQANRLAEAGFSLALDDFGTGHASIVSLMDLPISMMKIDRSFVRHIDQDIRKSRVVASMLAMARHMDLKVLAEGVETNEERATLTQTGCRYFQGYFFAKPMQAGVLGHWLDQWCGVRQPHQGLA